MRCTVWLLTAFFFFITTTAHAQSKKIIQEKARQRFGYYWFFDRGVMSERGTMSCGQCHRPEKEFGYSNGQAIAVGGVGVPGNGLGLLGIRNPIGLLNVGDRLDDEMNWDGRNKGLYKMCLQAVADPLVLGISIEEAVARTARSKFYQDLAELGYGSRDITEGRIRDSLVFFMKMLSYKGLPADQSAAGLKTGMPASFYRGEKVFMFNCAVCHQPENDWQDNEYHDIGIALRSRNNDRVRGRVTGNTEDDFKVRTPSLRGVPHTPPYMHDGSIETLDEVIGLFARGGAFVRPNGDIQRSRRMDKFVTAIRMNKQECTDLKVYMTLGFQGDKYPYYPNPHK